VNLIPLLTFRNDRLQIELIFALNELHNVLPEVGNIEDLDFFNNLYNFILNLCMIETNDNNILAIFIINFNIFKIPGLSILLLKQCLDFLQQLFGFVKS